MKIKILNSMISVVMLSIGTTMAWAHHQEVDCSTAKDDISTLEGEKKATSDKAVDGILGFTPIGLVANVATGGDQMDEDQNMSAEEYNKKIDEHIADIKASCGDALSSGDDTE